MNKVILLFLFALPGLLQADSFSCTVNGAPASCAAAGFNYGGTALAPTYSVSNSSFSASVYGNINGILPANGPRTATYSGEFDDTFYVPPAPAGDVFKVSILASNVPENPPYDGYGFGGNFSVQLRSNVIFYDPGLNDANPGVCYYHGCFYTGTIPAGQVTFVELSGGANVGLAPGPGSTEGAGGSASITLDLYKADGVTPDVFTPEPASFSLFALGGLIGAGTYCKRRRNVAL